jgi:ribosome maturation factor RimP
MALIEPVCQQSGYELVELRFVLEQVGWVLRVCVDLPLDPAIDPSEVPADRVDLQDCENLSRELSAVLDVNDPIPQAYSLEVSSPGIDRPLRLPSHFAYFAGSEAKIQLAVGLADHGDRKNFRGVLRGVRDNRVAIECDGKLYELPIDDIEHAKLVPDWDAVMKGKSGARSYDAASTPGKPGKHKHHKAPSKRDAQPTTPTHGAPGESTKEQG